MAQPRDNRHNLITISENKVKLTKIIENSPYFGPSRCWKTKWKMFYWSRSIVKCWEGIVYNLFRARCLSRGEIQKYAAKCTQTRSTQNVGLLNRPILTKKRMEDSKWRLTSSHEDLFCSKISPKIGNFQNILNFFGEIARDNGRLNCVYKSAVLLLLFSQLIQLLRGGRGWWAPSQNNVPSPPMQRQ